MRGFLQGTWSWPSWAVSGQPGWPLLWYCQYQLPGRKKAQRRGKLGKGDGRLPGWPHPTLEPCGGGVGGGDFLGMGTMTLAGL
jgi:hypothetical protein